jgi:hypothetical protein
MKTSMVADAPDGGVAMTVYCPGAAFSKVWEIFFPISMRLLSGVSIVHTPAAPSAGPDCSMVTVTLPVDAGELWAKLKNGKLIEAHIRRIVRAWG